MSQETPTSEMGPELAGLRCISLLGEGGFADVYLYEQEGVKIRVAVKLMKASVLDEGKRRQFAAEADTMAELAEHPYIVPVLGKGTAPDGRPFLVMRYYPSSDLAARVKENPMSVPDALRYAIQLASAVETAHRANIIHRDIKPSNVLVSTYGQPGLSDFGIAGRPNDADDDDVGVSMPWSPPEILTGMSNGSVTSDIYSLAATVWTLLIGHAPFHVPGGDNSERATFTRIVHSLPPATGRGDVPSSLDRLLQQALAKDPAHRPQSALELARHFQRVEQELRLARTEIVVLDQDGAAISASTPTSRASPPTPAPSPLIDVNLDATVTGARTPDQSAPAEVGSDDATQRRAPRRVDSVRAAPPSAWNPSPPPASTEALPADDGVSSPARDRAETTLAPASSQPTRLRPAMVTGVQGSGDERPASGRSRRPLIIGGVVVGLVVIIGVVVAVSGGGTSRRQAPGAATTQQAETNASGALPDASLTPSDPSTVSGRLDHGRILFSWPAVAGVTEYGWSVNGGTSHATAATRVSLARPAHGGVCITVHSTRPGASVTPGRRACVA